LISERYLPKYSADDIKQCYAILHNYIKKMEEESSFINDSKRPKTEPGYPSYTTTAMPPDASRTYGSPYNSPYSAPGVAMSVYNGTEGTYQAAPTTSPYAADPVAMRRGSYPMDSFSLTKAIPTNEVAQPAEFPTVEQQIYTTAAEYPPWNNAEGAQPQTASTPAPATTTTTAVEDLQTTDPQRGNNL
jgi:hypothetical protein